MCVGTQTVLVNIRMADGVGCRVGILFFVKGYKILGLAQYVAEFTY